MPEPRTQKQDTAEGLLRLDVAVDSITVGERHRHDLGDIDALAASIQRFGLLQPITVTPDTVLVCGYRRLIAIQRLGWTTTRPWVRRGISDRLQAVLAERDEEQLRKPLDDVEAAQLYREIKQLLAEDAARRQSITRFGAQDDGQDAPAQTASQAASQPGANSDIDGGGKLPPPRDLRERSRAQAARMVTGKASYKRLDRIGALSDIAEDHTRPERVRALAADALEQVRAGASVFPLYDRVKAELAATDPTAQAVEPVSQDEADEVVAAAVQRLSQPEPARDTRGKGRRSLRAWALLWEGLDGWWEHYDPTDVGAGTDEKDWAVFENVLDQTTRFAAAARAARDQAQAARRDRTEA
ncbi:ParB N-terminal domain-containing protein [Promicromonospora iranensis]|uniref:ParB family chromosome partitioning protein n=1 Tax=Promicromonospora iranensis TaxID=1105144 RepID=A0ABU2CIU3_9MICO|nr:ParB N-terminal domain-containing protein [Promicromonospora iranensis]MDR7381238.1 ParB family chromosome partitioning protein [Promicromonospora iranensis]